MKKFFLLGLVMLTVLLSGCQIPVDKIVSDKPEDEKVNATSAEPKKIDDINSIKEDSRNEAPKETASPGTTASMTEVTVYYKDREGTLIPITRTIKKEEGIAKAVLKSMVDNETNREQAKEYGLIPVFPENTDIKGISIKEEIATVDFNEHVLNYTDKKSEQSIVSAIVYALTEFKTIKGVKILINGKEYKTLKYGTDVSSVLSRKNILINTEKVNLEDKIKKVDIYLFKHINDTTEYILPVSVGYIGVEEKELPGEIIRQLSRKQDDSSFTSQLTQDTELIASRMENNVLVLDFNSGIKSYGGGTARESAIIEQILYSMKQMEGVEKVQIMIEGKKGELPEGSDISKPLPVPSGINKRKG